MLASIVACGDSAKEWYKVPCDLSVGCNDCVKFGHEVDYLVVVNSPLKFHPRLDNKYTDRLKVITDSKPKKFLCHNSNWKKYFPKAELLAFKTFIGTYRKGRVYCSKTSPFVAITLAASLGATEIILWGVDMVSHHTYSPGKRGFSIELDYYKILFEQLEKCGVKVWIGNDNTVLKGFLPVYISGLEGLDDPQTKPLTYIESYTPTSDFIGDALKLKNKHRK